MQTIDQDNDIITYSIEPAKFRDGSKYFRIDERSGDIFVKESLQGQVSVQSSMSDRVKSDRKSLSLFSFLCLQITICTGLIFGCCPLSQSGISARHVG